MALVSCGARSTLPIAGGMYDSTEIEANFRVASRGSALVIFGVLVFSGVSAFAVEDANHAAALANRKVSDLTVLETKKVQACTVLGYYEK